MNLQEEYNKMPAHLKAYIKSSLEKEKMLLLYIIETQFDKVQQVLESAGIPNPKPCSKCYGRYQEGFKYPNAQYVEGELVKGEPVVVLCNCVYKQLKNMSGVTIDWESKDEEGRDEATEELVGTTSKNGNDQGEGDK